MSQLPYDQASPHLMRQVDRAPVIARPEVENAFLGGGNDPFVSEVGRAKLMDVELTDEDRQEGYFDSDLLNQSPRTTGTASPKSQASRINTTYPIPPPRNPKRPLSRPRGSIPSLALPLSDSPPSLSGNSSIVTTPITASPITPGRYRNSGHSEYSTESPTWNDPAVYDIPDSAGGDGIREEWWRKKKWILAGGLIGLMILIAVGVGVGVSLSQSGKKNLNVGKGANDSGETQVTSLVTTSMLITSGGSTFTSAVVTAVVTNVPISRNSTSSINSTSPLFVNSTSSFSTFLVPQQPITSSVLLSDGSFSTVTFTPAPSTSVQTLTGNTQLVTLTSGDPNSPLASSGSPVILTIIQSTVITNTVAITQAQSSAPGNPLPTQVSSPPAPPQQSSAQPASPSPSPASSPPAPPQSTPPPTRTTPPPAPSSQPTFVPPPAPQPIPQQQQGSVCAVGGYVPPFAHFTLFGQTTTELPGVPCPTDARFLGFPIPGKAEREMLARRWEEENAGEEAEGVRIQEEAIEGNRMAWHKKRLLLR